MVLVLRHSNENHSNKLYFRVDNFVTSFCIATIFFCQVLLYCETSRHQKQIVNQQVSLEAREKFLKEKKASKLTATVLFFLILCYLPFIVARALVSNHVINSVNLAYIALFTGRAAAVLNSLLNPIIFCVRIKQFRVAFIQLMFKKTTRKLKTLRNEFFWKSESRDTSSVRLKMYKKYNSCILRDK